MAIVEYEPGAAFPGVIGRTAGESTPAWPAPVRARQGTPNVLFIVLDDTGFGQLGCYGSPIETPSLMGIWQATAARDLGVRSPGCRLRGVLVRGLCLPPAW
jgi:hypothetical protein